MNPDKRRRRVPPLVLGGLLAIAALSLGGGGYMMRSGTFEGGVGLLLVGAAATTACLAIVLDQRWRSREVISDPQPLDLALLRGAWADNEMRGWYSLPVQSRLGGAVLIALGGVAVIAMCIVGKAYVAAVVVLLVVLHCEWHLLRSLWRLARRHGGKTQELAPGRRFADQEIKLAGGLVALAALGVVFLGALGLRDGSTSTILPMLAVVLVSALAESILGWRASHRGGTRRF